MRGNLISAKGSPTEGAQRDANAEHLFCSLASLAHFLATFFESLTGKFNLLDPLRSLVGIDPGEKTFSTSRPQGGLSFLFRLGERRFA